MKADAETEGAVLATVNRWLEAIAKRDLDGFMELWAPDSDLVLIGTGEDEKRVGPAEVQTQVERDWAQSDASVPQIGWISVSAAGPVAWVAADMTQHAMVGGQAVSVAGRLTLVLEQRGDPWLIVQCHYSLPAYGQAEGESWPTSIDAVAASVQTERPDLRSQAAPDGTVTILFSDIEGSTAMTERLGDLRWVDVLRAHNAIVREQVADHGGFEVKSEGDGFMVAFQSARRALQCAIAVQSAFADYNAALLRQAQDEHTEPRAEPVEVRVRIGLHAGEVIKEADDFYGRHVILAARIADEARGGQILVSSLLKELTQSAGDIEFGAGREMELKGLSGSHRLYEVRWREPT